MISYPACIRTVTPTTVEKDGLTMSERADIKTMVQIVENQSATIADMKTTMDNLLQLTEDQLKKQTALLELIAHRLIEPPKSPSTN